MKQIEGKGFSSFYHVEFNSPISDIAFELKNNIDVSGIVDFQSGVIKVDSVVNPLIDLSYGMFTFQSRAIHRNARNESHIEGQIEKMGKDAFTYPIGTKVSIVMLVFQLQKIIKMFLWDYTSMAMLPFLPHTRIKKE